MSGKKKSNESNRRTDAEILHDRVRISELYLKAWAQKDIAKELGMTEATVSRDLAALRQDWIASAAMNFDDAKARELVKIDRIEREAWAAWEQSKTPDQDAPDASMHGKKSTTQFGSEGKPTGWQQTKETSPGDAQYMRIIQWCVEQRLKIIGGYAAEKREVTGKDGGPIDVRSARELTDDELARYLQEGSS